MSSRFARRSRNAVTSSPSASGSNLTIESRLDSGMRVCGIRTGIAFSVTPADTDRLRALTIDRNAGANMIATPAYIVPQHDLSLIEIDHLEERLYDHNRRSTGRDDGKALGFVAASEHGIQMGAIAGYSWAGVAEIKQLWVDGDHRGHGVGRRLLDAAIGEASSGTATQFGPCLMTSRLQASTRSTGSNASRN